MDVIKVAAGLACSIIILLLTLIGFMENPEKDLYRKTVESLMIQKELSSFQEVLDSFPELQDINSKLKRIDYLNRSIHSMTGGPSPNVSRHGSLQIQAYTREIRQLQRSIKGGLSQLRAIYAGNQAY